MISLSAVHRVSEENTTSRRFEKVGEMHVSADRISRDRRRWATASAPSTVRGIRDDGIRPRVAAKRPRRHQQNAAVAPRGPPRSKRGFAIARDPERGSAPGNRRTGDAPHTFRRRTRNVAAHDVTPRNHRFRAARQRRDGCKHVKRAWHDTNLSAVHAALHGGSPARGRRVSFDRTPAPTIEDSEYDRLHDSPGHEHGFARFDR